MFDNNNKKNTSSPSPLAFITVHGCPQDSHNCYCMLNKLILCPRLLVCCCFFCFLSSVCLGCSQIVCQRSGLGIFMSQTGVLLTRQNVLRSGADAVFQLHLSSRPGLMIADVLQLAPPPPYTAGAGYGIRHRRRGRERLHGRRSHRPNNFHAWSYPLLGCV